MIYRIKCNKDATITNNLSASYNYGLSNILEVYSLSQSNTSEYPNKDISRTLLSFDFTDWNTLSASGYFNLTLSQSYLYLYTVPVSGSYKTIDEILEFKQIGSGSWQEGTGSSGGELSQSCNWSSSSYNTVWAAGGGDLTGTPDTISITKTFDDVKYELSSSWVANLSSSSTYGIAVKYTTAEESDWVHDYYRAFYSRHSWNLKQPSIYMYFNDSITDYRNCVVPNVSATLYLYNVNANGELSDLSALPTASIYSNSVLTSSYYIISGSATKLRTGIYYYSFMLTSSYSGIVYDKWLDSSGNVLLASSSLVLSSSAYSSMQSIGFGNKLIVSSDVRQEYDVDDMANIRVYYYKINDYSRTGSLMTLKYVSESFYRVIDKDTGNIMYDYSYATKMSRDASGNWFLLPMQSLYPNREYKLEFMYKENGLQNTITSDKFSFRIREKEQINQINT